MPAQPGATTSGYELDRPARTIRFERDFAASPGQLFAAWTEPEHVTQWWDSTGQPLATCEIDLRVGGGFTYYVRDYPDMPFVGVYREIVPNERIEFDALGAIGRVTFQGRDYGTHMIVEIICTSAEQMEQFVQMGVHIGTSGSMDNLVRHLGGVSEVAPAG